MGKLLLSSQGLPSSELTKPVSTVSGKELTFSGMSFGKDTNYTQLKARSGWTGIMFGSPAPVRQSVAPATTSVFGSSSFNLSPGVSAFSEFVPDSLFINDVGLVSNNDNYACAWHSKYT